MSAATELPPAPVRGSAAGDFAHCACSWEGLDAARAYAQRMVGLLAPFSTAGTARFHVVDDLPRSRYLEQPELVGGAPGDGWWRLAEPPSPP